MLGLLVDIAVAGLLMVVIVYAVILHRRLNAVRQHKDELAQLLDGFGEATQRAERGVQSLKETATAAERDLDTAIRRAREAQQALEAAASQASAGGSQAGSAPAGPAARPRRQGPVTAEDEAQPGPAQDAGAPDPAEDESLRKLIGAARAEAFGNDGGDTGGRPASPRRGDGAGSGGDKAPARPNGPTSSGDGDSDLAGLRRPAARVPPRNASRRGSESDDGGGANASDSGATPSRAEEALRRSLRNGRRG